MVEDIMGMQAAQFQTNYTLGVMKMAMNDAESQAQAMIDHLAKYGALEVNDMESQAQAMIEMMSSVRAPAQYGFDVRA